MKDKLKPCQCKHEAYVDEDCEYDGEIPYNITYEVRCRNCSMSTGKWSTIEKAAEIWNTRQIEDALRKKIAQLQADNRSLVEQMNAQSEQIKLLNTALNIAAEDIDFDVLGTCPNEFENYGCPFGECKFSDNKPHENNCWKVAFIKKAKEHLRGEK